MLNLFINGTPHSPPHSVLLLQVELLKRSIQNDCTVFGELLGDISASFRGSSCNHVGDVGSYGLYEVKETVPLQKKPVEHTNNDTLGPGILSFIDRL